MNSLYYVFRRNLISWKIRAGSGANVRDPTIGGKSLEDVFLLLSISWLFVNSFFWPYNSFPSSSLQVYVLFDLCYNYLG